MSIILYATKQDSYVINLLVGLGCSALPTALTAYFIDSLTDKRNLMRVRKLRSDNLWSLPYSFYQISKIIAERYHPGDNKDKTLIQCVKDSFLALTLRRYSSEDPYDKSSELSDLLDDLNASFRLIKNDITDILEDKHTFEAEGVFSRDDITALKNIIEGCERIEVESELETALEGIKLMIDEAYENIGEIQEILNNIAVLEDSHLKNVSDFNKQNVL